jgi:glutamine amidotransferase
MAAVRSATDPLGIAMHNTQPFKFQSLSFVHNGYIELFKSGMQRALSEHLSDQVYQGLSGDTDSEHVFAVICDYWLKAEALPDDERLLAAVRQALQAVLAAARALPRKALLTLQVSDGRHLVAARTGLNAKSATLYTNQAPDGEVWLASEPLDESAGWVPLSEGSLVLASVGQPLKHLPTALGEGL